jgi:hypothetical protein
VTVEVTVIAPNEKNSEFQGQLKVENIDNSSDFDLIPVYLKTPKNIVTFTMLYYRVLEKFPILQKFLIK